MSKSDRIRRLLARGLDIKEIAKRTGATLNLVHQVKWQAANKKKAAPKKAKKKAVYKSERSKLIQAAFQAKREIEAAIKPKRVMINLARRKDGAIIDLNKGGEVISPPDLVNNPPHYTDGGVDTLTYIEAKDLNYRLGNVIKYVSRAGKKSSDPVQDLEKAAFYLKREIDARKSA